MVRLILCILLVAGHLSAKDRDWRAGTILDGAAAETYLGDVQPGVRSRNYDFSPEAGQGPPRRSLIFVPVYGVRETYVIESGAERFVATRVFPSEKPSDVANAKQVRFAVEKKSVFVLDANGREHKFKLVKKPGR